MNTGPPGLKKGARRKMEAWKEKPISLENAMREGAGQPGEGIRDCQEKKKTGPQNRRQMACSEQRTNYEKPQ